MRFGYEERIKKVAEISSSAQLSAEGVQVDKFEVGAGKAVELYKMVVERVKDIQVYHKETQREFKSIKELEDWQEGCELIAELGSVLLEGAKLGNG